MVVWGARVGVESNIELRSESPLFKLLALLEDFTDPRASKP